MNTKELENWIFKNNVIERTEIGFWKYKKL